MRFHKRWIIQLTAALAALFFAGLSSAAETPKHTLWKVKGEQNSVYLLGSIHVLKSSDYPLPHPMEIAYSNAAVVAFETDIAGLDDPSVGMKMMSKARLPEGESLRKLLSAESYRSWTNHLKKAALPVEVFEQMQPGMAAMTVAVLEIQQMGLDPNHGVDKHYFARARKAGKELMPLETVDFQVNLVTDFTPAEGEMLLVTTVKDMDSMKKDINSLIAAWKSGDEPKLEKLLNEASKEAPAIYKRMLTDRNQNWLPKIEMLARGKKNALVIVGAAHLVGKEGVVELLRKRGWPVTQE